MTNASGKDLMIRIRTMILKPHQWSGATYSPSMVPQIKRERKAGKGKGSESSGETSVAHLEFIVRVIERQVDELRSRVTELEAASM